MPPQAAILGEFEDHYTQILWPTLNVALTTTRNSNIQLDFSQKPRKIHPPEYIRIFVIILKIDRCRLMQGELGAGGGGGEALPVPISLYFH